MRACLGTIAAVTGLATLVALVALVATLLGRDVVTETSLTPSAPIQAGGATLALLLVTAGAVVLFRRWRPDLPLRPGLRTTTIAYAIAITLGSLATILLVLPLVTLAVALALAILTPFTH